MSNTINATVKRITESTNGTFLHILLADNVKSIIINGVTRTQGNARTYYLFLNESLTLNENIIDLDLEQFDAVPRDRTFKDNETGELITRTLTYLFVKEDEDNEEDATDGDLPF